MEEIRLRKLPCKYCRQPALARASPPLFVIAGSIRGHSIVYACKRCGKVTTLYSNEFAALPRMTPDEVKATTCDMMLPPPVIDPTFRPSS